MQRTDSTIVKRAKIGGAPLFFALFIMLAAAMAVGMKYGYPEISLSSLRQLLFFNGGTELERLSVLEIRLPRIVLGCIAGAMLGLCGVLLQDGLRNSLAGPELLGVSSGASFMMALITVLHVPVSYGMQPWFALLGGLIGGAVVILAAGERNGGIHIILIGAAVTAIMNGLVVWVITMGSSNSASLLFTFLMGNLANRNWTHVGHLLPWALVTIPLSLSFARSLNVLRLGSETAEGLGLHVMRVRIYLLIVCCAMTAAVVSQCGPIGYIALIAPHLIRSLSQQYDAKFVLPFSAMLGAVLLTTADVLARTVFMPREVPVGLWTTLIGGPVIIALFLRKLGGRPSE